MTFCWLFKSTRDVYVSGMIWIAFAIMTALSVCAVVVPLARPRRLETQASAVIGFYKAQVDAIEQDRQAGLISAPDANIASTEAARRMLSNASAKPFTDSAKAVRYFSFATILAIPAIALVIYLQLGNPDLADAPLAGRQTAKAQARDVKAIIADMEAHLAKHPEDGRAFALLAPVYMRTNRPADAAKAYEKALALLGEAPAMRADFAETLIAAADGKVTAQAIASLEMALKADPNLPKPRFYMGIAAEQAGDKPRALEIFGKLVKDAEPDAPYLPFVKQYIAQLGSAVPAPSAPDVAAVSAMPDADRQAMIHSMVDGLAARLAQKGDDPEGWLRLIRALNVLHEDTRAQKALADARVTLSGDPGGLQRIDDLAQQLGLMPR